MKIITIVGARPQFIKAAPVSKQLRKHHKEILVHTGQHYDDNMSDIFFEELNIPRPDYNLNVGSASHGKQTGEMLIKIEEVLINQKPDAVIVYGDTNSTLAGALAAAKLHIPVFHIESGLRSFNKNMPEEQNRVVVDHLSDKLFCPTQNAVDNLFREGITQGVYNTGDVMYDAVLINKEIASLRSSIMTRLGLTPRQYMLCTIHRAENTDDENRLRTLIQVLSDAQIPVVLPMHPRTAKHVDMYDICLPDNVIAIKPVGYLDMLMLETNAYKILTDSGGVQKEAYFMQVPCITLRDETEWVETVQDGWNTIVGLDPIRIVDAMRNFMPSAKQSNPFGDGHAAERIVELL